MCSKVMRRRMKNCPVLGRIRGRCRLILDTTYCDPKRVFPPQEDVIDFVEEAVRAELFNSTHRLGTLFVFGAYT